MKLSYQKNHIKKFCKRIDRIKNVIKNREYSSDDVKFGVGGNTFRALTGFNNPPSKTYRQWAYKRTKLILKRGAVIANQQDFEKLHKTLCRSIKIHWGKREKKKKLEFAHQYKMVDLYFKWLCANAACHESRRDLSDAILEFGHCPLDKNSLTKLNECLSLALPIKNPSMGSIHNKKTYDFCQSLIKEFTKCCGGTPLLFDFYVWPPNKQ